MHSGRSTGIDDSESYGTVSSDSIWIAKIGANCASISALPSSVARPLEIMSWQIWNQCKQREAYNSAAMEGLQLRTIDLCLMPGLLRRSLKVSQYLQSLTDSPNISSYRVPTALNFTSAHLFNLAGCQEINRADGPLEFSCPLSQIMDNMLYNIRSEEKESIQPLR